MALYVDGSTITGLVYVDGQEVNNVYVDGTLVWSKPSSSGGWELNWSGMQYIGPTDDEINNLCDAFSMGNISNGDSDVIFVTSEPFVGMANVIVDSVIQQADANYSELVFDIFGNEHTDSYSYSETLIAPLNNSLKESNLPWAVSYGQAISRLFAPAQLFGSSVVAQSANIVWSVDMNLLFIPYFEVTNLYYYKK